VVDNKSLSCLPAGSYSKQKKKGSSGSVIREFEGCGRVVCPPAGSSSIRVDRIWSMPIRSCGSCQHKQEQIAAIKRRGRAACSSYKTHTWNQAPTTHRHKHARTQHKRIRVSEPYFSVAASGCLSRVYSLEVRVSAVWKRQATAACT
jgi:hypothetical protein